MTAEEERVAAALTERVRTPYRGAEPGIVRCYGCGAVGRLPEFDCPHKPGCPFGADVHCPRCGVDYDPMGPDPCLGRLPGVIFACCGHGEPGTGYVVFANNVTLRFELDRVEAPAPPDGFGGLDERDCW